MKILLITKTLAEFSNTQGKLFELSKRGVDLTVVSPRQWGGKRREIDQVRASGYKLVLHECRFSGSSSVRIGNHLHYYPNISAIIRREKWDLVHIDEEPFNLATWQIVKACRRFHRKVAFTTWQNLMKKYPFPFNSFERYVFRNVAGAIAGNGEAAEVLRRRGFAKPVLQLTQLGIDPDVFGPRDATRLRHELKASGNFVVGFVGRLSIEKGVDTLIRALPYLSANSILVVVGSGPEETRLRAIATNLGLSPRIRWVPWVDSVKVPEYMNAFDVLVLPSRERWNVKEQFGRVLIEAMACETCVVGSDAGEIQNVVGDAGLIFQEDNVVDLASQLRRLVDKSTREKLRRKARERVLNHFTYSTIAEQTAAFYAQLCSTRTSREPIEGENISSGPLSVSSSDEAGRVAIRS